MELKKALPLAACVMTFLLPAQGEEHSEDFRESQQIGNTLRRAAETPSREASFKEAKTEFNEGTKPHILFFGNPATKRVQCIEERPGGSRREFKADLVILSPSALKRGGMNLGLALDEDIEKSQSGQIRDARTNPDLGVGDMRVMSKEFASLSLDNADQTTHYEVRKREGAGFAVRMVKEKADPLGEKTQVSETICRGPEED
jgi:hypothetical protein